MAAIEPVALAIQKAGFAALEITMNTPAATDQLGAAIECVGNSMDVGAGTVTSIDELRQACDAGASFIVTPAVIPEVISSCAQRSMPIFAGAYTPTEVLAAHRLGATMVKLFPAHRLGPGYLRDLQGPFPKIRFLATGGITPDSIPEYVTAGAAGFGIGGSLFPSDRIQSHDWEWVQSRAREYCVAWRLSQSQGKR